MAFRTNKTPVLQEKSASGSVATFNTALAMPLVKCVVSFLATQSGSGTPSPSNPRSIVPISSVDLSVNGTSVSVSLGENSYGGYLDMLTGKLVLTHRYFLLNSSKSSAVRLWSTPVSPWVGAYLAMGSIVPPERIFDIPFNYLASYNTQSDWNGYLNGRVLYMSLNENVIGSRNLADIQAYFNDNPLEFVYPLETPIELTLTPTQLSSVVGNNTFSTDTGTLDLTYKDLDIAKRGNFREVFKLPS